MSDRLLQLCQEQFGDVSEHYLKEALFIKDMCLIPNWGLSSEIVEQIQKVIGKKTNGGGVNFLKYYAKSNISQFGKNLDKFARIYFPCLRSRNVDCLSLQKLYEKQTIGLLILILSIFAQSFSRNGETNRDEIARISEITDQNLEQHYFETNRVVPSLQELESENFLSWFTAYFQGWQHSKYQEEIGNLGKYFYSKLFENPEQIVFCYICCDFEHVSPIRIKIIIGDRCIIALGEELIL
ncbi:MAG: hypothetical protein AAGA60_28665 [Cyanobacteria bacterium P01_E01_bin.42]